MNIFDFHIHAGGANLETVISFLDTIGAQKGAVLATDHGYWGDQYGTQVSNEAVAQLVSNSNGRLVGIASVNPAGPRNPAEELKKALCIGMKGLKLYPHSGFFPNDEALWETYELAQDESIPVLVHTGIKAHRAHHMRFNNPIYLDDVAIRFPRLKLVIMHAGYPWLDEALILSKLNDNIWVDLTFLDVLDYTFSSGLMEETIKRFVQVLGADKLVWGSEGWELGLPAYKDEGIPRVKKCIDKMLSFNFLSYSEKEKILGTNAENLLP